MFTIVFYIKTWYVDRKNHRKPMNKSIEIKASLKFFNIVTFFLIFPLPQ